jgi:hypothetical protein
MEKLFIDFMLFLCICIGIATALIPFYKGINDDINKRFKEADDE